MQQFEMVDWLMIFILPMSLSNVGGRFFRLGGNKTEFLVFYWKRSIASFPAKKKGGGAKK